MHLDIWAAARRRKVMEFLDAAFVRVPAMAEDIRRRAGPDPWDNSQLWNEFTGPPVGKEKDVSKTKKLIEKFHGLRDEELAGLAWQRMAPAVTKPQNLDCGSAQYRLGIYYNWRCRLSDFLVVVREIIRRVDVDIEMLEKEHRANSGREKARRERERAAERYVQAIVCYRSLPLYRRLFRRHPQRWHRDRWIRRHEEFTRTGVR